MAAAFGCAAMPLLFGRAIPARRDCRAVMSAVSLYSKSTLLCLATLACVATAIAENANESITPADPEGSATLPANLQQPLAKIEDFTYHFDQPGFYATVEHMKSADDDPATAIDINDWRTLVERPNDFRGRLVRIRGTVGRNKAPYKLESRPELGLLTQLELSQPTHGVSATVISTEDVGDIALGADAEFVGRFVMVRNFHTDNGRVGQAVLIVSPGPLSLSEPMPTNAAAELPALGKWLFLSAVAALVIVWILVKRANRMGSRTIFEQRAETDTVANLEDYLAENVDRADDASDSDEPRESS